jgi:acetyl-CoA acetyltransferase
MLIIHGESGRSGVGRTRNVVAPTSLAGQFEQPYGPMGPPTLFTIPVFRYVKTYGLTDDTLAMVSVVQREWVAKNPRATLKTRITVEDVLNSRMIAYPFRLLLCCLVTDGGGALILVAAEREGFPAEAGLPARHRRKSRDPNGQPNGGLHVLARVPRRRRQSLAEASITYNDVDHLMIYDAPCSLPGASFRASARFTVSRISALCRAGRPAPLLPSAIRFGSNCL